jgi:hypothetical protein
MRGCNDGRVPLFLVADVVVSTNSLVVIVAICASVCASVFHLHLSFLSLSMLSAKSPSVALPIVSTLSHHRRHCP